MVTRIFSLIITLFITVAVHASPQIEHWQTSNGARVFFVAAPELAMVDIKVVFDAGSAHDGDLSGTALLTNAMLSEGAAGLNTNQISAAFENVGAQFSNSSERDMALLSMRSLTADFALTPALEAFQQVLTQPNFPPASFERLQKQMLIGLQAEKQSPSAIASRAFYSNVYGKHPYAAMPAGDDSSVKALNVSELRAFYQQYYVANNAIVVLVGALNVEQAKAIAENLLAGLPAGKIAPTLTKVAPLLTAKNITIDHPSSQTHLMMGQPGISRHDPDYFALYVGNHILGGSGLVSQLSNEVREKRGLSYSVYSYFRPMRDLGPYQFGLQTKNDQAKEALDVVQNTLSDFISQGPSAAELTAAKQNITGGFALRLDSNSKIAGYITMIGFYNLPLDYLNTFKESINAISIEQIKEAYSRRIHADKMVTILVGGQAE